MSTTTTAPADFIGSALALAAQATEQANAIADEIAAASVNVNKMVRDLREDEDTEDEKVKAYQAFVAQIEEKLSQARESIDNYLKGKINASDMPEDVRAAKVEEYKSLKSQRKSVLDLVKNMPGFDESKVSEIPELRTLSGARAKSGGGTGTKRPRIAEATVNGEAMPVNEKTGRTNFSTIAAYLSKVSGESVAVRDLQSAAFEAAGTDDLSTVGDFDFVYSVNGENYSIAVVMPESDDE